MEKSWEQKEETMDYTALTEITFEFDQADKQIRNAINEWDRCKISVNSYEKWLSYGLVRDSAALHRMMHCWVTVLSLDFILSILYLHSIFRGAAFSVLDPFCAMSMLCLCPLALKANMLISQPFSLDWDEIFCGGS